MKAKELIEAFKREEYRSLISKTPPWRREWGEGEINLYAVDCGGYDCTSDLQVQFKHGKIYLIWEDITYSDDRYGDVVNKEIHKVELVEKPGRPFFKRMFAFLGRKSEDEE